MGLAFYVTAEEHAATIARFDSALAGIHQEITEFRHWCDALMSEQRQASDALEEKLRREIQSLNSRITK